MGTAVQPTKRQIQKTMDVEDCGGGGGDIMYVQESREAVARATKGDATTPRVLTFRDMELHATIRGAVERVPSSGK